MILEIQSAKDFVDTLPIPTEGEEGLSVDELIKLRQEQSAPPVQKIEQQQEQNKTIFKKSNQNSKNKFMVI